MSNLNEKVINLIKEEKNNQQDLYNKYYTLNAVIEGKMKVIKQALPNFEQKIKKKKLKLKESKSTNQY